MYLWSTGEINKYLRSMLDLCRKMEANTVAGPVLSGAVMATAVATYAAQHDYKLQAMFLSKPGNRYLPMHHSQLGIRRTFSSIDLPRRIVLVDDIISTGCAILHSIKEIDEEMPISSIVAIVTANSCRRESIREIQDKCPVRMFTWIGGKIIPQEEY